MKATKVIRPAKSNASKKQSSPTKAEAIRMLLACRAENVAALDRMRKQGPLSLEEMRRQVKAHGPR
ncbi:hypothetical protein IMCC26134_10525 [Verrucomicrobia bacterium IMCC26134]|nr:hypothetical protein IMCC26134_10525 [Verrucomicrobia bacterium IMCC26134]